MLILFIIIIVILVVGLIVLSVPNVGERKNRDVFLKEFAELLEGEVKPWDDRPGSSRIFFRFKGKEMIYEDIIERGLKENVNRGYLRLPIEGSLMLTFTERAKVKMIRDEKPESVPDLYNKMKRIEIVSQLPKELDGLEIHTNDHFMINQLMKEKVFLKLLAKLKNVDVRGIVSMPVRMFEGALSLDIYARGPRRPNLLAFYTEPHGINQYLSIMVELAETLESLRKKYE
ncbi:MAG: hypothetical protein HQL25_04040 [Candidatus Omnitrophica bacterium]|nr:hypothetical protein [Candidatus Omnitrophota bacterium]